MSCTERLLARSRYEKLSAMSCTRSIRHELLHEDARQDPLRVDVRQVYQRLLP